MSSSQQQDQRGNLATLDAIAEAQERALAAVDAGAPLGDALALLVAAIEGSSGEEVLGSVLLLDESGKHLRHGAAPSLPEPYNAAIDGLAIGPTVGSCGTAAHGGFPVFVMDIASDPLWADYKDLALAHGLRSCWSTPIFGSGGRILGTFAIYHREPAVPTGEDRAVVDRVAPLTARVIEAFRARDRER